MSAGSYGQSTFHFARNRPTAFQSGWTILHPSSDEPEFCGVTSSPAFDVVSVPDLGHFSGCVVVPHCGLFFFKFIYFIYFWLRWAFVVARGLSVVAENGGYSSLWCTGFSLQWLLLLRSMGSRQMSFSSCGTWAQ